MGMAKGTGSSPGRSETPIATSAGKHAPVSGRRGDGYNPHTSERCARAGVQLTAGAPKARCGLEAKGAKVEVSIHTNGEPGTSDRPGGGM